MQTNNFMQMIIAFQIIWKCVLLKPVYLWTSKYYKHNRWMQCLQFSLTSSETTLSVFAQCNSVFKMESDGDGVKILANEQALDKGTAIQRPEYKW